MSTLPERLPSSGRIGNYRLEREIGRGGMGVVYLATHVALERAVALKVLLPELAQHADVVERMLQEARCAAQITGQHVVRVIDVGQLDSGQPFIVMDYVEGEDLARTLDREGRPSVQRAVLWVMQACVAIAEAHDKGIVHRDLKPENLLLALEEDGARHVKVLDFGISKQLRRTGMRAVTRPNDLMGSPHYMAPEQIRTPLLVDARADLWALGTILIELLTGEEAFPGHTPSEVWASVLEGEPHLPPERLSELPTGLVQVARRAVQKDPAARFQSVLEFVSALAPYAEEAALPALAAIERRAVQVARRTPARATVPAGSPASAPRASQEPSGANPDPSAPPAPALRRTRRKRAAALLALLAVFAALGLGMRATVRVPVTTAPASAHFLPQQQVSTPLPLPLPPNVSVLSVTPTLATPALEAPPARVSRRPVARPALAPAPDPPPAPAPARPESEPPARAPHNPWDLTTFGGRL